MSDSVDGVSSAFLKQRRAMRLCHDLMGGTDAMLAAGPLYIPLENGESQEDWGIRLNRTILFNVYKRTLRYLCGRVFGKPVTLSEDASQEYMDFVENVDRMGRNLTVWGRHAFEAGLNDGVTFCVVDFSNVRTRMEDGVTQYQKADGQWANNTQGAASENGWAPYFVHVDAGSVLDARLEWFDGKPAISHFRYVESIEAPYGKWDSFTYERVRAFYLDENRRPMWEVWSNRAANGSTGAFELVDAGEFSIGVLPVVPFIPGDRTGPLTAEPALMDLAQLNKRHWQATCGHFQLMEYVRRPPWFGKCLGEFDAGSGKTRVVFGPGKLCHAQDASAMLQSVGVDSASVAASKEELEDLEKRMAVFGLQLLQPKTGLITATESRRDSEENNSTLKAWTLQFQDFLENCMDLAGLWLGRDDAPSVSVNTEFADAFDASLTLEMYRAGAISRETLLAQCRSMGLLPDDFDVAGEASRLEQEAKAGAGPSGLSGAARSLQDVLSI